MKLPSFSVSQIYAQGKENLEKRGSKWEYPPDSDIGASVQLNRKYLDSLFFETKFFDPVEVDTGFTIFGVQLKTPVFCSPISKADYMLDTDLAEIAKGVSKAGALMMLGIGGSQELQSAIDTGGPVVKMVKPYRETDLIYKKVRDAESRGCVAVGMDIDHFYGRLRRDIVDRDEVFGPQSTDIDFSIPSMVALPRIVESVGDTLTVFVDTGFKTGNDILKALAFGAKAAGFASSMILACAADGAAGVELLINKITAELRRTMAATGCPDLKAINRSIISQMPPI
jgi:isopentenyl diphosphate isomerase/L-lactate dehydrogenase-like FMN-dependent dehydrogenase